MRLMVLLSRVPYPLEKGDKLRAYHQIKHLSKKHEIVLCCLNDSKLHPKAIEELSPFCYDIKIINLQKPLIWWNVVKGFFSKKPFQVHYFYQKQAQKKVDKFIEQHMPKHIYCQLLRTAEYVKRFTIIPKTLDYQDAFSKGAERRVNTSNPFMAVILKKETKRLTIYEAEVFEKFNNKIIISEQDKELIHHPKKEEIEIIPNGVDTEYFSPIQHEKNIDIVFTGNMNYPPNIEAACFLAKEIMPLIWQQKPNAKLLLSGASPTQKVQDLKNKQIEVTGWVKDIRTSYARAKVFIAPMQLGTGLQNKLLEAMAMEVPCITSDLANNALGAKKEEHLLIANTPTEFAEKALNLLANQEFSKTIAQNGKTFVKSRFNWESTCEKLEAIISHKESTA